MTYPSRSRQGRPTSVRWLRPVAAAVLMTATLSGCSAAEEGATSIRLADSYPVTHPFAEHGVSEFIDDLAANDIETDYFPSGQMGSAQDLANMVRSDVIDIGPVSAAYLEDELPLSSVSDLPNMTGDACVAAGAMMDLLSPGGLLYETEYEPRGLRPLWIAIIPGYEVMTATRKVERPGDVEGLLLRSSGGAFDVTMDALDASAVSMSAGDTYEAMTRGTVDGTALPFVSVIPYNIEEVAGYSTEGLNLGSVGIPYAISEDSWQRLSERERDAVDLAAERANDSLCAGLNKDKGTAREQMETSGVRFTPVAGKNAQDWNALLADVRTDWAESLDGAGLPGSKVLDAYESAVKRHEHES